MITEKEITIRPEPQAKPAPPIFPTNSVEFVNSLAHYYRGEMSRMMSWRDRLDRTTNWAIAAVAAMLSVSLSSPESHHGVLLFAMVLVFLLLSIESRRYRFFHVYRSRVRLVERNYYARIFAPREMIDPSHWMSQLGEDLRLPRFSMVFTEAMARRLRRNYIWLFLILLAAWMLKTSARRLQSKVGETEFIHSTSEWIQNASLVGLPGWAILGLILIFYAWMFYIMFKYRESTGELAYGDVHV
jgi:uncharacterized membrane protein